MTSLLDLVPPARTPCHLRARSVVRADAPAAGPDTQTVVDEVVRQCLRDLSGVPEGALAEMAYRLARARLSALQEPADADHRVGAGAGRN